MNSAEVVSLLAAQCIDGGQLGAEHCSYCRAIVTVMAMREALATADREASIAHDAIWHAEVHPSQWLHDGGEPLSGSAAIWRIHDAIRPLLVSMPPGDA